MMPTESADALRRSLGVFSSPMFAVERDPAKGEFRVICVNDAYERATGLDGKALAGRRPHDLLPEPQAQELCTRYAACLADNRPLRYRETLDLPQGRSRWDTTIQPVERTDGTTLIVGTALPLDGSHHSDGTRRALDDILFLGVQAQFQLHRVTSYIESVSPGSGDPVAERLQAVAGVCRSIASALGDIRDRAERACGEMQSMPVIHGPLDPPPTSPQPANRDDAALAKPAPMAAPDIAAAVRSIASTVTHPD
ncbi:PAS domain S-box-containing protein [Tranquillimonas alkanivorans]|uniref:PAS domain S-box-containing protein n=2 Tax=Tranquillimonas alkanivorans TaxID=441119 RepID=A0A1I5SG66_9RHOB|nr:PAS domain S-box-containing protein [Tranquillimonas alkanivorans]